MKYIALMLARTVPDFALPLKVSACGAVCEPAAATRVLMWRQLSLTTSTAPLSAGCNKPHDLSSTHDAFAYKFHPPAVIKALVTT